MQSLQGLKCPTQQGNSLVCHQATLITKPPSSEQKWNFHCNSEQCPPPCTTSQHKNQQGVKKQEYILESKQSITHYPVTSKDSAPSVYKVAATKLLSELLNILQSAKNKDQNQRLAQPCVTKQELSALPSLVHLPLPLLEQNNEHYAMPEMRNYKFKTRLSVTGAHNSFPRACLCHS